MLGTSRVTKSERGEKLHELAKDKTALLASHACVIQPLEARWRKEQHQEERLELS